MANVAWFGLGLMGRPMSRHLINAGHHVTGFDIDPVAQELARAQGVDVKASIAEAVADCDVVFSMLPTGADVFGVMAGNDGAFAHIRPGTLIVDCSTIGIDYARKLHAEAAKSGVTFVEAPVSGGTEGAIAGTLTFMTGGTEQGCADAAAFLEVMGGYIARVGDATAGQAAKIVNNLIMGVCVTVNCEATDLAQRLGLDMKAFFEIAIRSSADNWSLRLWNPAPDVVPTAPSSKGYAAGFKTWLLEKDLSLAVAAGQEVGANLATAEAAQRVMRRRVDAPGGADMDATSLVLTLMEDNAEAKSSLAA